MTDYTFAYTRNTWKYPGGTLTQNLALSLERWTDGQIHLLRAYDVDGQPCTGWLDDMLREWVQSHQHTLWSACCEAMEADVDLLITAEEAAA